MRSLSSLLLFIILLLSGCNMSEKDVIATDICIFGGTSAGVIAAYSADMLGIPANLTQVESVEHSLLMQD